MTRLRKTNVVSLKQGKNVKNPLVSKSIKRALKRGHLDKILKRLNNSNKKQ